MKKKSIFNYEINESVQAHAAMNCLRNRNTHKSLIKENCGSKNRVQEQEENSRIEKMSPTEKFDERFKYSSRIRKMANDITKEAYMIIRNEYGDGMWRALHMDDCDEFGLVSQINDYQKYYGITNPQDIVDCLLGKKSVKSFKKSHEEQEETKLSESEIEELTFKLADYLMESFIVLEDEDEDYSNLLEAVEKILRKDAPKSNSDAGYYAWCRKWFMKIEDLTYSYYNEPNPKSYYTDEEDDEDVPTLTGESVQTRTMKGCLKNKKQLNEAAPLAGAVLAALRPIIINGVRTLGARAGARMVSSQLAKNVMSKIGNPETISKIGKQIGQTWDKIPEELKDEIFNMTFDAAKNFITKKRVAQEQEENVYSDVLNKIINDGLDYWDVWEMAKQGKATKTELEISSVLLDLFETLMYNGYGQILSKVSSGEIDKRELKRIIVDILMEQDVDTFPKGESEYNSWVNEHNSEIVKRLEAKFNEEQEEYTLNAYYSEDEDYENDHHGIWLIINLMRKKGMLRAQGIEGRDNVDDGHAINAAYDLIEQKLNDEGMWIGDDDHEAERFVSFFGEEIAEEAMKSAIHNQKVDDMEGSRKKYYSQDEPDYDDDSHGIRLILNMLMKRGDITKNDVPRAQKQIKSMLDAEGMWIGDDESEAKRFIEMYWDNQEQEELPSMERHDMILALSEYMAESWIDTGDDGDLDDIYYAVAEILDNTGDYPASTDWEDCKPWCQKHYKEVEARIYNEEEEASCTTKVTVRTPMGMKQMDLSTEVIEAFVKQTGSSDFSDRSAVRIIAGIVKEMANKGYTPTEDEQTIFNIQNKKIKQGMASRNAATDRSMNALSD